MPPGNFKVEALSVHLSALLTVKTYKYYVGTAAYHIEYILSLESHLGYERSVQMGEWVVR